MKYYLATTIILISLNQDVSSSESLPIIYQPNPDSPIEKVNVKADKALEQYSFLIGDWDVNITWKPKNQKPLTYNAKWHNHWIIDGHAVMQEWRGPYLTGMEIRYYNPKTKQWTGKNLYVNGDWKDVVAEWKNGEMIVKILDAEDETGKFINRETYYSIKKDSFKMKSDRSYDNETSWVDGDYIMDVIRSIKR